MKVSVVIIAKDSQEFIEPCIKSAKNISDDVVVVIDDASSDDTEKIAKSLSKKLYHHPHVGIVEPMRKFAISKTKYDWVLLLDADEELSSELQQEIINILPGVDMGGYRIPRLNYIFGKPMYHTNWGPDVDRHIWLFNKNLASFEGVIHEEIKINGDVKELTWLKIHNNYSTVEEFMEKLNRYTSRETKALNPFYDFLRRYIWHRGFLDGWHGLFLSYLMMIYHLTVWVKLWQKKNLLSSA